MLHRYEYSTLQDKHTVYRNELGTQVPSVTTVLKMINKDELLYWANFLGMRKIRVEDELKKTATIGTHAHKIVEDILLGNEPNLEVLNDETDFIRQYTLKSIMSFARFYKENKSDFEIIHTEIPVITSDCGGTIDIVCKYKGELTILDIKTSGNFYYSQFLQVCKYAEMYNIVKGDKPTNVAILRLDKKDGDKAVLFTMNDLIESRGLRYTKTELMDIYADTFNEVLKSFYMIYDIEKDWK